MTFGWRKHLFLTVLFSACSLTLIGCGPEAVNMTGRDHAAGMIELQYEQVCDNLARFVWDENSLPSHVVLTQGIAQVSDRLDAGVTIPFNGLNGNNNNNQGVNLSGERQWTVNWSVKPVVEGDSLVALQNLYRDEVHRSVSPDDRNIGRKGSAAVNPTTNPGEWPSTQGSPWFQITKPKDVEVAYKGSYRSVTVYVTAEHMQELSAFTVDVLRNSPYIPPILPGAQPALNP